MHTHMHEKSLPLPFFLFCICFIFYDAQPEKIADKSQIDNLLFNIISRSVNLYKYAYIYIL